MVDGELSSREAERIAWDVIVVGTGMGGGMVGYSLARSGRRVLFVEKGRSTLPGTPGTIRSAMPELAEPAAARSADAYLAALARAGRSTDEVEDVSGRIRKRFVPFIGSGTGGSSAIYGMVCERFFVADFTPRQNFPNPGDSTVPEAWPITYGQLAPWYAQAEKLLRVRGQADPLRPEAAEVGLPGAPPFSADNQPVVDYLSGLGLHPYHLPMACEYTDGCATCQTYLCPQSCKNDAARTCVLPAVREHGAKLLTECRVVGLDADRTEVRRVICEHRSGRLELTAKVVVLAAGALATPVLLLDSRSGDWPNGLANGSDMVGRNLMRHMLDPIEIWPQPDVTTTAANKEIGLNDFYFFQGHKYGTVQSFGAVPPMEWLINRPTPQGKALRLMRPAVRQIYEKFFTGGLILATMMEDLPYLDNRVLLSERSGANGRQRMRIQYRLHPNEIDRHAAFQRLFQQILKPFRQRRLGSGKDNSNMGHVCGTCRFGTDPTTTVLDPQNRTHEVENLYVVDTSFFPSSAGLNPSLTVAANALRVAEHVDRAHFPS
ncbi:GMC oxidoreductase [Mycolicibacterium holsaticum]|uniref:GMC oxidoreductase n=1 Tax=Mycolicibacterium holsaticum TaxID=152142 RepID=UPI001C7D6EC7|nr:GMC family oxidoreductase [Mycolicibacterium holsaticum]MDA4110874.1 glucose-methanol-choline oxidoreductase [Mycolicibacterium holsaticum DSM 44478 = JCM 12374]QZA12182.1 GMC family oxidoreductase [Mycolicibacterium holsaticum DSM 44478 = JCM 12374]UNC10332.1 GMC family oxidoreductase [Mycolicibacterium holsaticum DSM 44478 = JCM 12374]